jgi:phosphoglycerate dehydrogenase-like enzyme
MPRPVVLVTRPEYRRGEPVFASCPDLECVAAPEDEPGLIDAIQRTGSRRLIIGSGRYGERLYAVLPKGAVMARYGVGHDTVDKAKATEAGVLCTNTPDVLHQSVAELTMAMIGAAARHVVPVAAATAQGAWAPRQGLELHGKTLALIGCGAIGRAVARIAAAGFGMRVTGYVRPGSSSGDDLARDGNFDSVGSDFAVTVDNADFVSLHIPGHPENVHFIDRDRLQLLPARAWVINTARGAVVDEAALFDVLSQGGIAGAALDVSAGRSSKGPADPAERPAAAARRQQHPRSELPDGRAGAAKRTARRSWRGRADGPDQPRRAHRQSFHSVSGRETGATRTTSRQGACARERVGESAEAKAPGGNSN